MRKLFLLVVIVMAAISAVHRKVFIWEVASACGETMMWIKHHSLLRRM